MTPKKIAHSIARPVWQELPFFLFTMLLWAPTTWITSLEMIVYRVWEPPLIETCLEYTGITLVYSYLATLLVWWAGKRWLKIALYVLSLLNFYIFLFVKSNFHAVISPDIMQLVAETTTGEATEFVAAYALGKWGLVSLGLTLVMAVAILVVERWFHRWRTAQRRGSERTRTAWTWATAIALLLALYPSRLVVQMLCCRTIADLEQCHTIRGGTRGMDNLTSYLYSSHTLRLTALETKKIIDNTLHEARQGDATCTAPADSLTLVVVIGESYIKRHAGIYGYRLPTTPRMEQERQAGRLTVFTDVISPYNSTSVTLKNALSCNVFPLGERWQDFPMMPAVMKRAGYYVTMWDNQIVTEAHKDLFTFSLNAILYNRHTLAACYNAVNEHSFKFDDELVDDFKQALDTLNMGPRRLIMFHLMGQHIMAQMRYPNDEQHTVFHVSDYSGRREPWLDDDKRQDIAHYDNATRYQDLVLGHIIDLFAHDNTVLVFFSDHGEETYDYRDHMGRALYGRDLFAPGDPVSKTIKQVQAQLEVPFAIWCSDRYRATHPQEVAAIAAAASRPFMNVELPQLLFTLGHVKTRHHRPEFDPLSPSFKPHKRLLFEKVDYDALMKGRR